MLMKKILFLFLLTGCTSHLYIGQNRDGFLVVNDAVFRRSRADLYDLLVEERYKGVVVPFCFPEDIVMLREYETYNYKLTRGYTMYHRRGFEWRRVTFLPAAVVDSITLITVAPSKDTVSVLFPRSTRSFVWKPETPKHSERWAQAW